MNWLDLTLSSPSLNLALDEALLDQCEEGSSDEVLRFWEPREPFVVLGYSNKVLSEVNLSYCRENNIPVLRRTSGGGTVLQGPGCLNYSLVLASERRPETSNITRTNGFIMEKHRACLEALLGSPVRVRGHTDLAHGDLKFSGNAQRRKRNFLLFHGTFLLDFDLPLVEKTLSMPSRQPDYRKNRPHRDFVANVPLKRETVKEALKTCWGASERMKEIPEKLTAELDRMFSDPEFIHKF
ncbi:MAG TPA: lipoate--protein ligase family protein [Verrucomicrobiae bacterium]|jgi:lipoate-protein ligase A|nr:lipoate--protein ligase family protein [Verrucomicrobiae bacterium]